MYSFLHYLIMSLLVIVIYFSVLEDQELACIVTYNLLPYLFDVVKYCVIKCEVHRWRWEANDMVGASRQHLVPDEDRCWYSTVHSTVGDGEVS
jgi:hypothetical protein